MLKERESDVRDRGGDNGVETESQRGREG